MQENANQPSTPDKLIELSAKIITAYLSNNTVDAKSIPKILKTVHTTLQNLKYQATKPLLMDNLKPAVPIKKSITDEYIICLEDGKKLKMMKRYLRTKYKLSPQDYIRKWGLPCDYPMVAPNHAARRSAYAKQNGLGKNKEIISQ